MAWTVDPRSNELMLEGAARRRGLSGGGCESPLAMRFDLLAAVQLRGNFKQLLLLRILLCLAAAAARGCLASVLLPLATSSVLPRELANRRATLLGA